MIKFEYIPNVIDTPFGALDDPPPVESVTMTLGGDVSWEEAVCEFHNFLRASGYVIPYDFEDYSNTGVAPEDESNTDVADEDDWRGWTPLTLEEIQDLESKHQKRYNDGITEPYFDLICFAKDIEKRLKELNT